MLRTCFRCETLCRFAVRMSNHVAKPRFGDFALFLGSFRFADGFSHVRDELIDCFRAQIRSPRPYGLSRSVWHDKNELSTLTNGQSVLPYEFPRIGQVVDHDRRGHSRPHQARMHGFLSGIELRRGRLAVRFFPLHPEEKPPRPV